MLFEADGGVRYVQESAPTADKASTTAAMFLVPFETITSLGVELPTFSSDPGACARTYVGWPIRRTRQRPLRPEVGLFSLNSSTPWGTAVFSRLNTMTVESRSIHGGEHLVCVYGDNWLQVRWLGVYLSRRLSGLGWQARSYSRTRPNT